MTRTTAKWIDRAFLLLGTVCLAGNSYGVPSHRFWDSLAGPRPWFPVACVVVVGVFGALNPFETWNLRATSSRAVTVQQQLMNTFGKIIQIAEAGSPPISACDLGLHVWRRRASRFPPFRSRLVRLTTFRLGSFPINRPFAPARGVGVIGRCWEFNREESVNVAAIAAECPTREAFDVYRSTHGAKAVMNLTWGEFDEFRHRGAVLAAPVRNRQGNFIGCLSVDAGDGFDTLNQPDVRGEMNKLCFVLGQDGFDHV